MSSICVVVYVATNLWWWKSCASLDGKKGRWYPLWETVVLSPEITYHSQATERWDPMIKGPNQIGHVIAMTYSMGCE